MDVASKLPQDPKLFIDAIHMTDTGERVKAWIVFQQLVPIVRSEIESGWLPRPRSSKLPPPASMATSEMELRCDTKPSGTITQVADVLGISRPEASAGAVIQRGPPLRVISSDRQWAYAATFRMNLSLEPESRVFALVRARVLKGRFGIALFDQKLNAFVMERSLAAGPEISDVYMPLPFPGRPQVMIFRNAAQDGVRSEIQIEEIRLVASK